MDHEGAMSLIWNNKQISLYFCFNLAGIYCKLIRSVNTRWQNRYTHIAHAHTFMTWCARARRQLGEDGSCCCCCCRCSLSWWFSVWKCFAFSFCSSTGKTKLDLLKKFPIAVAVRTAHHIGTSQSCTQRNVLCSDKFVCVCVCVVVLCVSHLSPIRHPIPNNRRTNRWNFCGQTFGPIEFSFHRKRFFCLLLFSFRSFREREYHGISKRPNPWRFHDAPRWHE